MVTSLWKAFHLVEAAIAVAFFVILLFNRQIGEELLGWRGIDPRWAWIPVILVALHIFFGAIYGQYQELERDYQDRLAKLTTQRDEVQGDLKEALANAGRATLEIQYDPSKHFTRRGDGINEIRFVVKNAGDTRANRVRVKIEPLIPLTNKKDA